MKKIILVVSLERDKRIVYWNSRVVFHHINIFNFNKNPRKRFLFFRIDDRSRVFSEINRPLVDMKNYNLI